MMITITKNDLDLLEREYENALKASYEDDEDIFIALRNIGMCRVRKGDCRSIINGATKYFNNGHKYYKLKVSQA